MTDFQIAPKRLVIKAEKELATLRRTFQSLQTLNDLGLDYHIGTLRAAISELESAIRYKRSLIG